MELVVPELSLVVLVGPSGAGKSTFGRTHFRPTEVISSDFCRVLVSDDENDQGATANAFDVLRYVAGKRLARGRLTVEGLERFVRGEPLRRTHECVFAVLALESEPVDPRL